MINSLLTADIHLTDKERDSYRWGLFDWAVKVCLKHKLKRFFVLGDVTDAKDNHSAKLTNKVVSSFCKLLEEDIQVTILLGNHDYYIEGQPFFKFLNNQPGCDFIDVITYDSKDSIIFLPHTKTPLTDWEDVPFDDYDYAFMHQTVKGSIASNGMEMEGELSTKALRHVQRCKLYSGDIHVPQVMRNVEYVGSPYHVHFGDRFQPRCIMLKDDEPYDIHFKTLEKFSITIRTPEELEDIEIAPKSQLKIKVNLPAALRADWLAVKKEITAWSKANGLDLRGIDLVAAKRKRIEPEGSEVITKIERVSAKEALTKFGKLEKVPEDYIQEGCDIIATLERS